MLSKCQSTYDLSPYYIIPYLAYKWKCWHESWCHRVTTIHSKCHCILVSIWPIAALSGHGCWVVVVIVGSNSDTERCGGFLGSIPTIRQGWSIMTPLGLILWGQWISISTYKSSMWCLISCVKSWCLYKKKRWKGSFTWGSWTCSVRLKMCVHLGPPNITK